MRRSTILYMYVCALFVLTPTTARAENELYTNGRAATIAPGRAEIGLWSPTRLPLNEHVELYTRLLLNLLLPHMGAKIAWPTPPNHDWYFASTHELSYPSWFYATSPLYTGNTGTPQMLTLSNGVLMERRVDPYRSITLNMHVDLTPSVGDGVVQPIDIPWLYPRFGSHRSGYAMRVGARWRGHLTGHFAYWTKAELFVLPEQAGNFALEHHFVVDWQRDRNLSVQFGTLLTMTPDPGRRTFQILPYFDIIWAITGEK